MDVKLERQAVYQQKKFADKRIDKKACDAYAHKVEKLSKQKFYGIDPHDEEALHKYEDKKQLEKFHQIKNNPNQVYKSHEEKQQNHKH